MNRKKVANNDFKSTFEKIVYHINDKKYEIYAPVTATIDSSEISEVDKLFPFSSLVSGNISFIGEETESITIFLGDGVLLRGDVTSVFFGDNSAFFGDSAFKGRK